MTDDTTRAENDAETAQAHEDATQAAYEAKPACDRCGHHPGDVLHDCRTAHVILAPDGAPARSRIEASEVESMGQPTLEDFLEIVDKWASVTMTPGERQRQARHLMARHPLIDRAYRDGLRIGRDLRERSRRGLGWTWPSLMVLTPREIGFVMARVRKAIGVES